MELSIPEALRVIEETVKFLNKKNNQVQEHIRTIKDKDNQRMVDFDIHRYSTLKASVKSLKLQIQQDGEELPIPFVHKLYDTIKQHKQNITLLEIKFQNCTGRDIPYKDNK